MALGIAGAGNGGNGNGAPSGSHYTLNIIGVSKPKTADMDDSNRHTIFVPLTGRCWIGLAQGAYNVADGNCFDGDGAEFRLPDPDPDGDGVTAYSVYARALGKPGGSAQATSCVTDENDVTWCSTENVVLVRDTGKSSFRNVSKELLTVCLDTDGDGTCDEREFLFDDSTHDYLWRYDNTGLRLAQLRFYEIPTNVGLNP
jgi:hypothetical protein